MITQKMLPGIIEAGSREQTARENAKNELDKTQLAAYLKGQLQDQEAKRAQAMFDTNQSSGGKTSVKMGDTALMAAEPDMAKQQMALQGKQAHEADSLVAHYNRDVKPLEDQIDAVAQAQNALASGSTVGDKAAQVFAARLTEGKGQRLLAPVIEAFHGTSAPTKAEDFVNWISGQSTSAMSPEQRAALANFYGSAYQQQKGNYQKALEGFQQRAPVQAPGLASSGQLQNYMSTFGGNMKDKMAAIEQGQQAFKQGGTQQAPVMASGQNPAPQQQAAGGLRGFIQGLFGQQSSAAPQTAPQAQTQAPTPQGGGLGAFLKGPQQASPTPKVLRVKHAASGQIGTIDPTNPKDAADLQAGIYQSLGQ